MSRRLPDGLEQWNLGTAEGLPGECEYRPMGMLCDIQGRADALLEHRPDAWAGHLMMAVARVLASSSERSLRVALVNVVRVIQDWIADMDQANSG